MFSVRLVSHYTVLTVRQKTGRRHFVRGAKKSIYAFISYGHGKMPAPYRAATIFCHCSIRQPDSAISLVAYVTKCTFSHYTILFVRQSSISHFETRLLKLTIYCLNNVRIRRRIFNYSRARETSVVGQRFRIIQR